MSHHYVAPPVKFAHLTSFLQCRSKQVHEHYLPKLLSHNSVQTTTAEEVAARNRLFNVDGLGVAWYTPSRDSFDECQGDRPALYRTIQPPLNDLNFRSICANTATKVCFAHIRAATATPVTPVNNHPFIFGRYTIMHNGYVSDFLEVKRSICNFLDKDAFANIHGSTDSEHVAAMFMTYLAGGEGKRAWENPSSPTQMEIALKNTVQMIIKLQENKLGSKAQPNDLNVAISDGEHLIALRYRNHPTEQPPSLYYSETAGVTLNRKYPDHADGEGNSKAKQPAEEHGKHLIVASEPTTYKDKEWILIDKNHFLKFDRNQTRSPRTALVCAKD